MDPTNPNGMVMGGGQCESVHDDCRLPSQAECAKARAVHRFLMGSREADCVQQHICVKLRCVPKGKLAHDLNDIS